MKIKACFVLGALTLLFCGCKNKYSQDDGVISERYIHKYGYAVAKDEWQTHNYPGQAIVNLRNGVTITKTYENGVLHGPCTHTYPHSQIVAAYFLYNNGDLAKEIRYDVRGMPTKETVQLSPSRYALTLWYDNGCPMSVEEFAGEEVLEGQYFTMNNEIEARIEKGNGKRIKRDQKGVLQAIEEISKGYVVKRETFYAQGTPESLATFAQGKLHGERRTYAPTGEPLAIEEWIHGKLHGKAAYFKSGHKFVEISYLQGLKNGLEVHFVDGDTVSQQISWENNMRHGPATYFLGGATEVEYYYNGEKVTQKEYEKQLKMDDIISQISPELRTIQ